MMVHCNVTSGEMGCETKVSSSSSLRMVVNGLGPVKLGPVILDRSESTCAAAVRFASERLIERRSRRLDRTEAGGILAGECVALLVARLVLIGPLGRTVFEGEGDCDLRNELEASDVGGEESSDASLRLVAIDVRARGTVVPSVTLFLAGSSADLVSSDWTRDESSNKSDDAWRDTRDLCKVYSK